jgi:REP element-mobilizing transposase RayT
VVDRTPITDSDRLLCPYAPARNVRYFEPKVVYHVISRTRGNRFLLRPDLDGLLRKIIAGVLAQGRDQYPTIGNCGTSVLSNHLHALLFVRHGDVRLLADYIGYIKREIARRWSHYIDWNGSIFGRYRYSAIITADGQRAALNYVIGQGTKENLVEHPFQWPGFHCAESLASGRAIDGVWFDGTRYGKARHADRARVKPQGVRWEDYCEPRSFGFDKLPRWSHLSDDDYHDMARKLVTDVVALREHNHPGKRALGPDAICMATIDTSAPVLPPPWFEQRKHMIVWDDRRDPEVRDYIARYWTHQVEYRCSAKPWRGCTPPMVFPDFSFVPGLRPRPIAHMEQSTA